ncbi:hypothetical protein NA57DRAFT_41279 [Rhizodiscina lignyota]|uniref:RING-CH-type domain-containing protein n=1 Tax=Rhizodiscina lignyota TaxID=1504668 RepID=A0A9P4IDF2_9PEZI|nr:hypothetical protein NA57DRAFT_41279 [Rhizodiscina lignyota]
MASIPPRHASQRRSSPPEAESSQAQLPRTNSEAISETSDGFEKLILDRAGEKSTEPVADEEVHHEAEASAVSNRQINEEDVRKCWICFSDETEDTPMSSEWRSPCPCALVAHEECLLDWIADMQAPNSRQRAGSSREVRCPQCKSRIYVSQPQSLIVEAVRKVNDVVGDLVLPWGGVLLLETIHSASYVHGAMSIIAVFGEADAKRILQPLTEVVTTRSVLSHLREHWRLHLGIPLIPSVLILSRTGGSLADSLLPIIPVLFFATSAPSEDLLPTTWPPSATMTFALLPYVRSAYNAYLDLVWGKWEKQWLKEVLPRSTRPDNDADGGDVELEEDGDVLEIDVDIVEEWEENEEVHEEHQREQEQRQGEQQQPQIPPQMDAPGEDAPPLQDGNAAPADRPVRHREARRWDIALSGILDTVLGALAFPGIAAAMGGLLKLALPRSLTRFVPGQSGKPTGLLQTRWGRTVVGGCLFVALKDAIILYARWRVAQNHRQRKIRNYDKVAKKVLDAPGHTGITL